jgi:hypothetical protein
VTTAQIAAKFGIDPDQLQDTLAMLEKHYRHNEDLYHRLPDKKGYRAQYQRIEDAAEKLIAALEAVEPWVRDTLPSQPSEWRLERLRDTAAGVKMDSDGKKPFFHRKRLVLDMAVAWKDLTGKAATQSKNHGSFNEFMGDATSFMGIDNTGLWRIFRNDVYPVLTR